MDSVLSRKEAGEGIFSLVSSLCKPSHVFLPRTSKARPGCNELNCLTRIKTTAQKQSRKRAAHEPQTEHEEDEYGFVFKRGGGGGAWGCVVEGGS